MTYSQLLRPHRTMPAAAYDVTLIVGGAVLIALMARIAIHTPFSPVPITGQTFAVLLLGALLGWRRGTATILTYIGAGLAGLPVFADGKTGLLVLSGPTLGYLVGFIAAAALVGYLAERGWDQTFPKAVAIMAVGSALIYTFGMVWLALGLNVPNVFAVGVLPFLVGDAVKVALAAALLPSGWAALRRYAPAFYASVESTP